MKNLFLILLFLPVTSHSQVSHMFSKVLVTGSLDNSEVTDIKIDSTSSIYLAGSLEGNADFDPSVAVNSANPSYYAHFLAKYDLNGNYLYSFLIDGVAFIADNVELEVAPNGEAFLIFTLEPLYTSVNIGGTGPPVMISGAANGPGFGQTAVVHYNSSGQYLSHFVLGPEVSEVKAALGNGQNLYLSGRYSGVVDFDPGVMTTTLDSSSDGDHFIAKYNSSGLVFAKGFTLNAGMIQSLNTDVNNNIFMSGFFTNTADLEPGAGLHAVTTTALSAGMTFKLDTNGNWPATPFLFIVDGGLWDNRVTDAIPATDGNHIFLTGRAFSPYTLPGTSAVFPRSSFVTKYHLSGTHIWSYYQTVTSGRIMAAKLAVDQCQQLYATGLTDGNATIRLYNSNGTLLSQQFSPAGFGYDHYWYQFGAPFGSLLWAGIEGSGVLHSDPKHDQLALDPLSQSLFYGSAYNHSPDLDPTAGSFPVSSAASSEAFFTKLQYTLPTQCPLDSSSFNLKAQVTADQEVLLSWTTFENSTYSVERSTDCESYQAIATSLTSPTHTDNDAPAGKNCYRVIRYGENQDRHISKTAILFLERPFDVKIFPQPNNGTFINLKFSSSFTGHGIIFTAQGQEVQRFSITDQSDVQIFFSSFLAPGAYTLKFFSPYQFLFAESFFVGSF